MHELSIAQSLLDIVLSEAQAHGVTRVVRVGVRLGAFTNLVPDSLRFCFDLIKENTVAAQAELMLTEVPSAGLCHDCGQEIDMAEPVFKCPACGSDQVEMTQGRELLVDFIETEDPEAQPPQA